MFEREKLKLAETYKDATKEQLIEKLAEVQAAAHGVAYALDALDSRGVSNGYSRGCTYMTSYFFPEDLSGEGFESDGKVFITKWNEGGKTVYFEAAEPAWDGKQEINYADSLNLPCTTYANDDVVILAAHESAMACYISGGAITFGDVRILRKVLSSTEVVLPDIVDTRNDEQSNNNVGSDADSEKPNAKEGD